MFEIPIFPTIFYGLDVPSEINERVKNIIESLDYESAGNHPDITDPKIHNRPELKFYIDYLDKEFNNLKDKNGWTCDRVTITSMWVTRASKGVFSCRHHHPMHWYSFIHYLTEGSATHFYDKDKETPPMMLGCGGGAEAVFQPGNNIPVGSLLFFPSHIPHSVEPHMHEHKRYTIAGNVFPEGKVDPIGDGVSLDIRLAT